MRHRPAHARDEYRHPDDAARTGHGGFSTAARCADAAPARRHQTRQNQRHLHPAIQLQLDSIGDTQTFDPNTARPSITAKAQQGRVKIDGRKPGFEAVNIYSRIKGAVQWKLIAVRKRKFPYFDESPLAVAGTPEVREYMAIGVLNDEELGQPSEIKEVVYAG